MTLADALPLRRPAPLEIGAILMVLTLATAPPVPAAEESKPDPEAVAFFETSVRPVLVESCLECHGPEKQKSDLRVDSREALLKGGALGPAIEPGNPEESLLIHALAHDEDGEVQMPPKGKLPDAAIEALTKWVAMGAPWGESAPVEAASDPAATHWAFQPLHSATAPEVQNPAWVQTPIDAWILAGLERAGMSPSPAVDRRTLIRRATVDLIGVPPTLEEIEAFENDPAPDAFARVVDRLLASPLYGERWGRHWLDVARYADTKGYVFQEERKYPYAYTYRDYVIDAFNNDLPFNQFVLEQLAADQLPPGEDNQRLAAMGFLTVGRRFLQDRNEIIDDRIDIVGRGLLGLTIACARCHDHKFDPIPIDDYYSLYGVFASSIEPAELPRIEDGSDDRSAEVKEFERRMEEARKVRDDYKAARRAKAAEELRKRASLYVKAAHDLDFDGRSKELDERAKRDELSPALLRFVARAWKTKLDAADSDKHPVLAAWRLYRALPQDQFAEKAGEVLAQLEERARTEPGSVHPLLLDALRAAKPTDLDQVASCYAALFGRLEERTKDREGDEPLAEADWESLRLALRGEGGALDLPDNAERFLFNVAERNELSKLNQAVDKLDQESAGVIRRAMVMNDAPKPTQPHVFIRGNPGRPGKVVPRQFLEVLSGPDRKPFDENRSGRLELAQSIVDTARPLTARVIVNRVWAWHFGRGLVDSPSDFGVRADPPTHPELLDELAAGFIADGWSIKSLHRRIMLSSVYQQQSALRDDCMDKDAENRLLWRFNRQRLDFESLRDSILAVSGSLDTTQGGPSVVLNEASLPPRRTVYGFIDRQNLDGDYRSFDFSTPDATSARRFVTTVPQQALFLMNSPFVLGQAKHLASAVEGEIHQGQASADVAEAVNRVYRRVLGRSPTADELARASAFVDRPDGRADDSLPPLAQLAQVLMLTNEFLYVD